MHETFFEWYPLTEAELEHIWRDGVIVPDANVFLSFYRWSDKTRNEMFALLERFADRLWVPHQAALEYHRSRIGALLDQMKACRTFIDRVERDVVQVLQTAQRQPMVSEPTFERLRASWTAAVEELNQTVTTLESFIADDPIRERLTALTQRRVGPPLSAESQARIEREGPRRYEEQIPPGYRDDKKKRSPDQKWGDLVVWFQMIEEAARSGKPMIFVTGDEKEDWWRDEYGRKLGARPELIVEFRHNTGQLIVFYTPAIFSEHARDRAGATVAASAVQEMRATEGAFGYSDQILVCMDCNSEFDFKARDQEFYAERGWTAPPRRCRECARARRLERMASAAEPRQMYSTTCTNCGANTELPFKPAPGKPVLCRNCYREKQDGNRGGYAGGNAD